MRLRIAVLQSVALSRQGHGTRTRCPTPPQRGFDLQLVEDVESGGCDPAEHAAIHRPIILTVYGR